AEPDPGRARRDRRDHRHRIGDVPALIVIQQMVPDEETVPAMLLGRRRELHQQQRVAERAYVRHPYRALRFPGHPVTLARRSGPIPHAGPEDTLVLRLPETPLGGMASPSRPDPGGYLREASLSWPSPNR